MQNEDVIKSEIGFSWLRLDVRALLRTLRNKPDEVTLVAERFVKIFKEHGVSLTEIPRLIPEVTLAQLKDRETLVTVLTPQVLEKTANLFRVQQEWLEGTTNRIYRYNWCYKSPEYFFEAFRQLKREDVGFPVIAFVEKAEPNMLSGKEQPIVLVLREPCAQIGDKTVYRYSVFDDGFIWDYWKCRIQIKAMMRILFKKMRVHTVPVYQVSKKVLRSIESGAVIPYAHDRHHVSRVCLADYGLSKEESRQAREVEELPTVLDYIKTFKLGDENVEPPMFGDVQRFF